MVLGAAISLGSCIGIILAPEDLYGDRINQIGLRLGKRLRMGTSRIQSSVVNSSGVHEYTTVMV